MCCCFSGEHRRKSCGRHSSNFHLWLRDVEQLSNEIVLFRWLSSDWCPQTDVLLGESSNDAKLLYSSPSIYSLTRHQLLPKKLAYLSIILLQVSIAKELSNVYLLYSKLSEFEQAIVEAVV